MSAARARAACAKRWPFVRVYVVRDAWDQRELYRWIARWLRVNPAPLRGPDFDND